MLLHLVSLTSMRVGDKVAKRSPCWEAGGGGWGWHSAGRQREKEIPLPPFSGQSHPDLRTFRPSVMCFSGLPGHWGSLSSEGSPEPPWQELRGLSSSDVTQLPQVQGWWSESPSSLMAQK